MCMKNLNTDVVFFKNVSVSGFESDNINLYDAVKTIPVVEVKANDDKTWIIPQISLMLSINALNDVQNEEIDENTINFGKTYAIRIRVTETSSGQCVDLGQVYIHPVEEKITLCKHIYTKKFVCRFNDIIVTIPPQGKDLCVFKVLVQEVIDGKLSDDKWVAQSMHPVRLKPEE